MITRADTMAARSASRRSLAAERGEGGCYDPIGGILPHVSEVFRRRPGAELVSHRVRAHARGGRRRSAPRHRRLRRGRGAARAEARVRDRDAHPRRLRLRRARAGGARRARRRRSRRRSAVSVPRGRATARCCASATSRIEFLHTPGHTPEHISVLVREPGSAGARPHRRHAVRRRRRPAGSARRGSDARARRPAVRLALRHAAGARRRRRGASRARRRIALRRRHRQRAAFDHRPGAARQSAAAAARRSADVRRRGARRSAGDAAVLRAHEGDQPQRPGACAVSRTACPPPRPLAARDAAGARRGRRAASSTCAARRRSPPAILPARSTSGSARASATGPAGSCRRDPSSCCSLASDPAQAAEAHPPAAARRPRRRRAATSTADSRRGSTSRCASLDASSSSAPASCAIGCSAASGMTIVDVRTHARVARRAYRRRDQHSARTICRVGRRSCAAGPRSPPSARAATARASPPSLLARAGVDGQRQRRDCSVPDAGLTRSRPPMTVGSGQSRTPRAIVKQISDYARPGSRLAQYEIVEPIGSGGMGEVYRARDSRLDRDVAIKVMAPHVAADPEMRRRFETEARAVAALSHPSILAIHELAVVNDVPVAVMELLEGETLRARLQAGRAAVARGRADRRGDRRRPRRGARARRHPPRPQAGERLPHQRRRGQDPRLRPGAAAARDAASSTATVRRWRTPRRTSCSARSATCRRSRSRGDRVDGAQRHLRARLRALRDAERPARCSLAARRRRSSPGCCTTASAGSAELDPSRRRSCSAIVVALPRADPARRFESARRSGDGAARAAQRLGVGAQSTAGGAQAARQVAGGAAVRQRRRRSDDRVPDRRHHREHHQQPVAARAACASCRAAWCSATRGCRRIRRPSAWR